MSLKWRKLSEKTAKNGYTKREMELYKSNQTPITLADIKKMDKEIEKSLGHKNFTIRGHHSLKEDEYVVRGLNQYKVTTIKSFNGYLDDEDNYFTSHGYDQEKFDKFYKVVYSIYTD